MATLTDYLQHALSQKDPFLPNETKRILLKEALQAYVLDFLYNHPGYRRLNFYGGTCLHIVYGLNRLSEDIDLDNSAGINLDKLSEDLIAYFQNTFSYPDATAKVQQGENSILRITMKFPVLFQLKLASHSNEALHLKIEISPQQQVAVLRKTPTFSFGRSFVIAHFSLETLMAGKILACLERNFHRGREGTAIKGRDYYDLLWLMQHNVQPLAEKLAHDGKNSYSVQDAMNRLNDKVQAIRREDMAVDLYPLFEQRSFIEAWLDSFHENFKIYLLNYL